MPVVPIVTGPSIQATPLQGGYLQTPDVSSGLRSLAGGLNDVANFAEKVAVDQESQRAFATDTKIKSDWIAKDAELRKTYRGSNVEGYQAEVKTFWDEAQSTAQADLGNLGKQLVSKSLGAARLQAQSSAQAYFTSEVDRAQNESFNASKTVEIQRGLVDGRPEAIAASADILRQRNAQQGGIKGWSTEQLQAVNLKDSSDLFGTKIAQLANTDPTAAKAMFDQHREDIDASRHGVIERTLGAELQNQQARQTAASLATKPLADQLEEVAKINDPNLREKTLQAVRENHGLLKAAQQQRESDAADNAWQLVGKGQRVPEVALAQMDGRQRVQLVDYLRSRAEHMASKGNAPVKTDPMVHAEMWDMLVNDPAKFKAQRLTAYAFKLAPNDLEQLAQQQQKLQSPKTERDATTLTQQMSATMNALKITKPEAKGQFLSFVQGAVDDAQSAKKAPLSFDERQSIIDRAVLQGPDPDRILPWGEKRLFQLTPDARSRFQPNAATDAPATELDALNEALKAQGLAQTPANRMALYTRVSKKATQ